MSSSERTHTLKQLVFGSPLVLLALVALVLVALLSELVFMALLFALAQIADGGSLPEDVMQWIPSWALALLEGTTQNIVIIVSIAAGTGLIRMLVAYGQDILSAIFAAQQMRRLRENLANHLLHVELASLDERHSGDIMAAATHDLTRVQDFLQHGLAALIRDPLLILGLAAAMFWLDPWLVISVSLIGPGVILLVGWVGRMVRRREAGMRQSLGGLQAGLQDRLSNLAAIRMANAQARELRALKTSYAAHEQLERQFHRRRAIVTPVAELLGVLAVLAVLGLGVFRMANPEGALTLAMFIPFVFALVRIAGPVQNISKIYLMLAQARGGMTRIQELLGLPRRSETASPAVQVSNEPLEAHRVSFRYPDRPTSVLTDVSLAIQPGEIVLISGPNGSGKTTLLKLLCGLLSPTDGRVTLGGVNVSELDPELRARRLAWVSQDVYLLDGSVRDNLLLGLASKTDDELWAALDHVGGDFVRELPGQLEASIGEGGRRLSGGQRQRLALARAWLRRPQILILDEATSQVDRPTEKALLTSVFHWPEPLAVVLVTHRPTLLDRVDRVLSLQDGRLLTLPPSELRQLLDDGAEGT